LSVDGPCVAVVGAGYQSKRRAYERLTELGTRVVIADEPGHWSESLAAEGAVSGWVGAPVSGDPDADARGVVAALEQEGVRPDGVLTFWEDAVPTSARVAAALGLPGNPVEAVDAARSKVRTRDTCARLGLPGPRALRVRSLDELYAAASEIGFPAVVKPEFGASALGCVKVDRFEALADVYTLVRRVVRPETDGIFRAGSDLLLEEYLDGVEFDVDLVMEQGDAAFSSVSQNWPTHEPSFQETGLHCPPDHKERAVRRLVDFSIDTVRAFGFHTGVLHVEGKATSQGPRVVEVNARLGGTRIDQIVKAVWGVDLVEAQLRSSLGLPQTLTPSRRPRCAVVNALVHAPRSGRLESLSFREVEPEGELGVELDVEAETGDEVAGPEEIFASVLAELTVSGRDLRRARALAEEVLRDPPVVAPAP
jgi:carnosine synthase